MKLLRLFAICSLLAGCKTPPPDVVPCLMDIQAGVAHCSPVDASKKSFDLPINQMNKYFALSSGDFSILLQWMNSHNQ